MRPNLDRVIPTYHKAAEASIAVILTKNEPRIAHSVIAGTIGVAPRIMMQLIAVLRSHINGNTKTARLPHMKPELLFQRGCVMRLCIASPQQLNHHANDITKRLNKVG